jgi:uncharacterized protein (TIGR02246 family)
MRLRIPRFCLAMLIAACSLEPLFADENQVREAIKKYVDAFNAEDVASIAKMWADNATHVDHSTGERTDGKAKIVEDITAVFSRPGKMLLSGNVESVRLIGKEGAVLSGEAVLADGQSNPSVTKFTAILVKQNDSWVIDSMEEIPLPQVLSASTALKELEWLVGSWQDDSSESPVRSTVRWSAGGSFLIRTFEAADAEGTSMQSTQVIGWDPRAQNIRSWTFDNDGSFGDGVWSKHGDNWHIVSSQTLTDGRQASGTYVLKPAGDAFTVQLIGHEVEGEPQPASEIVNVKRAELANASAVPAVPSVQAR